MDNFLVFSMRIRCNASLRLENCVPRKRIHGLRAAVSSSNIVFRLVQLKPKPFDSLTTSRIFLLVLFYNIHFRRKIKKEKYAKMWTKNLHDAELKLKRVKLYEVK